MFAVAFILGMWACTSKVKAYKDLSASEFEELIKDPDVQILDVRTLEEHNVGFISRSVHISINNEMFSVLVDEMLRKDLPIAVYCRSGRRSRLAAEKLASKGFVKVYNLDKGIENWKEEGREISIINDYSF